MRTRKRPASTSTSVGKPATTQHKKQKKPQPEIISASVLAQLRHQGFTVIPISAALQTATLTVAAKAFQGQLEVCSKQPPEGRLAGFRSFPQKQRLDYRPGDAVLGNVGVVQHLAVTVQSSYSVVWHHL